MRTRTKVMLAVGAIALGTTTMVGASLADGRGGRAITAASGGGPGWRSERSSSCSSSSTPIRTA